MHSWMGKTIFYLLFFSFLFEFDPHVFFSVLERERGIMYSFVFE
jgi:hypothetical protein